jgi:hypothetical protein
MDWRVLCKADSTGEGESKQTKWDKTLNRKSHKKPFLKITNP